ncbi:unnamed protein product [Tetraodon nigroviridis]|uniref:(spotted green pufferfish) hypothetical protein n=1 Tax=Tetraodon nigroviridis TaxID=99883 RepID=Q4SL24_TETNG|nr:unnamed protein product [Tetraodon nigroviridis]
MEEETGGRFGSRRGGGGGIFSVAVGQPIHLPECAQSRGLGNRCSRHRVPAGDGLGLRRHPPVQYRPSGTIWTPVLRAHVVGLMGFCARATRDRMEDAAPQSLM